MKSLVICQSRYYLLTESSLSALQEYKWLCVSYRTHTNISYRFYIVGPYWQIVPTPHPRGIYMSHNDTDTCYLNTRPKLDNLTLKPAFDVSMSSLCLFYDVSHLFALPGFFLRARVFQHATDSPYSRQVGVVFWSPRGFGGPKWCRLTFTPGERWELWEQSVLVC